MAKKYKKASEQTDEEIERDGTGIDYGHDEPIYVDQKEKEKGREKKRNDSTS